MMLTFRPDEDDEWNRHFREELGPKAVDEWLKQAVRVTWLLLPKDKRNVDELKSLMQGILDRIIRDMEKDRRKFDL